MAKQKKGKGYFWCQTCRKEVSSDAVKLHKDQKHAVEWIEKQTRVGYLKEIKTIPDGYEPVECFASADWYIILGDPPLDGDERVHNCDMMDCGQSHVIARFPREAANFNQLIPIGAELEEYCCSCFKFVNGECDAGLLDKKQESCYMPAQNRICQLEADRDALHEIITVVAEHNQGG